MLPKELRDTIDIYQDSVILKKFQPDCNFCGSVDDVAEHKDKNICKKCTQDLLEKRSAE